VHMLARVLALEWALQGIRCNAIAPAPCAPPWWTSGSPKPRTPTPALAALARVNPLAASAGREIAALAAIFWGRQPLDHRGRDPIDGGACATM